MYFTGAQLVFTFAWLVVLYSIPRESRARLVVLGLGLAAIPLVF